MEDAIARKELCDSDRRATKETAERIADVLADMAKNVRDNYDKIDYLEGQYPDSDTYVHLGLLADLYDPDVTIEVSAEILLGGTEERDDL